MHGRSNAPLLIQGVNESLQRMLVGEVLLAKVIPQAGERGG